MSLKSTYKNRLKSIRIDNGFAKMDDLAAETGISRNMLYRFERGESDLSITTLIKLLWVLDCTFEDLVEYEVESDEPNHIDDLADDLKHQIKTARAEYMELKQRRKRAV